MYMSECPPTLVTVVKLTWCCLLAGIVAAALMFPFAGGIGMMSNRASDVVANGSAQLLEGDAPQVTTLVDTAGNPIAWLYTQRRFEVPSDQIADTMKLAIVSIEDKRFAEHNGVDWQGTLTGLSGYMSGDMLCSPRALFAFGRDRLLPRALASVHARFHTPWVAIVVHSTILAALAMTGSFAGLLVIANVSTLLMYLLCAIAAYELQRRDVRSGGTPFVLAGGPLIPVAAAAVIMWLLSQATAREYLVTGAVLAVAAGYYVVSRRVR